MDSTTDSYEDIISTTDGSSNYFSDTSSETDTTETVRSEMDTDETVRSEMDTDELINPEIYPSDTIPSNTTTSSYIFMLDIYMNAEKFYKTDVEYYMIPEPYIHTPSEYYNLLSYEFVIISSDGRMFRVGNDKAVPAEVYTKFTVSESILPSEGYFKRKTVNTDNLEEIVNTTDFPDVIIIEFIQKLFSAISGSNAPEVDIIKVASEIADTYGALL